MVAPWTITPLVIVQGASFLRERANALSYLLLEQFLPSLIVDIDNLTGTLSPE
jgi:hypothetical protein